MNATTDPTPKGWRGRWKLPLATCPALHFVAALQLPTFPGLSVYPTPTLHGAHFVTGSESWSVVPAAQSLQSLSFVAGAARIQGFVTRVGMLSTIRVGMLSTIHSTWVLRIVYAYVCMCRGHFLGSDETNIRVYVQVCMRSCRCGYGM